MAMTKATNDLTYAKTKRDEAEAVLIKTKASLDNITKDDKDYPKFRCIYLKALIVFKKAQYNATEALIKLSFIDISEILLRKDTKTTPKFDNDWKEVNNLNFSRISSSRFNDIKYLTSIQTLNLDHRYVLDDLNVLDNLDDLDNLDVLNVTDLSMAMTKATNDLTYAKTKQDEAEAVLIKTKASLDNITKDDKDYPKFKCIYLKALIVFKKAKYDATEALIKFSFIDISEILLRKDTKTTPKFDNDWKEVNNLNFSRISSSNPLNLDHRYVLDVLHVPDLEDEKFEEVD